LVSWYRHICSFLPVGWKLKDEVREISIIEKLQGFHLVHLSIPVREKILFQAWRFICLSGSASAVLTGWDTNNLLDYPRMPTWTFSGKSMASAILTTRTVILGKNSTLGGIEQARILQA
jgi:hypothetical protein